MKLLILTFFVRMMYLQPVCVKSPLLVRHDHDVLVGLGRLYVQGLGLLPLPRVVLDTSLRHGDCLLDLQMNDPVLLHESDSGHDFVLGDVCGRSL